MLCLWYGNFASLFVLKTMTLSSNSYEILSSSQESESSILQAQGRVPMSCSTPKCALTLSGIVIILHRKSQMEQSMLIKDKEFYK